MGQRVASLPVATLLLALALAGCVEQREQVVEEALVYEHAWSYGPGYGRTDPEGDPIFLDSFHAIVVGTWTMTVESHVAVGTFEVRARNPRGEVSGFAASNGTYEVPGEAGTWSFEITTDAPGEAAPEGRVAVRIVARG